MTILIADDHAPLRKTLKRILENAGYEQVLEAEDGEVAKEVIGSRDVDVLVLDLHMPRRDGLSLLQGMGTPPPVVVVMSAFEYVSPNKLSGLAGSHVFHVFRKPVAPRAFLSAIERAMEASRSATRD
jgi:DNA-binding NtrC family response regulator